jgi:hypothetical protein
MQYAGTFSNSIGAVRKPPNDAGCGSSWIILCMYSSSMSTPDAFWSAFCASFSFTCGRQCFGHPHSARAVGSIHVLQC